MQLIRAWYSLDTYEGHGVKYHPNVTQNGYTERGNPQWLSVTIRRPGRMPLRRRMPQEANALGNARDMQTWGRHARRRGCRKSLGLRRALMDTGCPGVLKTGRKSNPDCACAKLRGRVTAPNGVPMTKARVTEEPRDGKLSRGVR